MAHMLGIPGKKAGDANIIAGIHDWICEKYSSEEASMNSNAGMLNYVGAGCEKTTEGKCHRFPGFSLWRDEGRYCFARAPLICVSMPQSLEQYAFVLQTVEQKVKGDDSAYDVIIP